MSRKFDLIMGSLFQIEDLLCDINDKIKEPKKKGKKNVKVSK